MRWRRRLMAEDEFWNLVAVMGGRVDDDALERLTDALRARSRKEAVAFQERLASVLYDLDREELAAQRVRFGEDPPDSEPIPLSDDSFLYLRAGIVARGRATYDAVRADPSALSRGLWDFCEELLYVAEEVTGDDIETEVSYETGENATYWPPRPEPEREPWDEDVRPVYVECRDLSNPIEGETVLADRHTEPFVMYPPPRYLGDDLGEELCLVPSRIVALNGGLPANIDAHQVQVIIDFGASWHVAPEVGDAFEDEEFGVGRVRPVRVAVAADEVRRLTPETRREALLALAAACVLAVLPEDHAARPELERINERGAAHLRGDPLGR